MLQNDLQQMRASNTGEEEEARHESDDSDDAPPSHLRLPSSSTLQEPQAWLCPPPLPSLLPPHPTAIPPFPSRPLQPPSLRPPPRCCASHLPPPSRPRQVAQSMSSMLRLLSDGVSIQPMWARGGIGTPRAALLSGGTDEMVALPFELPASPSNPASPLAVSRLPLVDWRDLNAMEEDFQLDGVEASGTTRSRAHAHVHAHMRCSCPICLEPFDEKEEDGVLQMPCARQHMFHRSCLLQWLQDHNSCPVCRHCLPTQEDEEQSAP